MVDRSSAASQALAAARRACAKLTALPEAARPRTIAEGYAAQAAFRASWGDAVAGWKVGATAEPVQAMFKISHPFFGPVFKSDVVASPARLPAARFQHLMIESEFAMRLGRDLAPRATPYSRAEIIAAVDVVMPSFELISPRFEKVPADAIGSVIADCGLNGGEVLGEPVRVWSPDELPGQAVTLTVNGRLVAEGSGASVLGHPVNVLEWLLVEAGRQGITLAAGQFVSTGTCTGLVTIAAGETAVADFGRFGRVEVRFD